MKLLCNMPFSKTLFPLELMLVNHHSNCTLVVFMLQPPVLQLKLITLFSSSDGVCWLNSHTGSSRTAGVG
jgi:hypothetical protein